MNAYHPGAAPADRTAATSDTSDLVIDGEVVNEQEQVAAGDGRPGTEMVRDEAITGELVDDEAPVDRGGVLVTRRLPGPLSGHAVLGASRRTAGYLVAGGVVVVRRWRDAHGLARFERQLQLAEAAGDQERLREWHLLAEQAKQAKHQRQMDRRDRPLVWLKGGAAIVSGLLGLLVVTGIVLALTYEDIAAFTWPFTAVAWMVRMLVLVMTLVWIPVLVGTPIAALVWLGNEGRKNTQWTPAWMQTPGLSQEAPEAFAVINEDMITRALAHCGVASLNKALKRGESLYFDVLPRQQGGGTYMQVRLPFGCVAKDFLEPDRIERLAGNLGRHMHEVYPQRQPDADARVLDLWIADQGTMDRPAPPWPLLFEGEFDVFRDAVPWGVTMRGEQVEQGMLARHILVGAVSKQGKTATMRLGALALALDPTVELRIADLKGDGDWSMFQPRAHTLIEGSAEEQTETTCTMLEALVTEMMDRYERKRALGVRGEISRKLSRQPGSGFHPIYAIVDECQVLYQEKHPVGGTKADARGWRAAKRLHDQARAVNIHLWQATQRPDPTAIPAPVREGPHVRISLYVANYSAAKMVLADAADMGARPQDLRPGRDRGTFVATGEFDGIEEGMAFLIVKSHYVSTKDAYPVIERAMDILRNHGRTVEHTQPTNPAAAAVDHLADIAAVIGDHPRMRTQEVLNRLAERNRGVYGHWNFTDLRKALPDTAKPYKSHGEMHINRDRLHEMITQRDQSGGVDGGDHDADR